MILPVVYGSKVVIVRILRHLFFFLIMANSVSAQTVHDLPLVVLKLGVAPPFKCAFVISGEINDELYQNLKKSLGESRNPSDCHRNNMGITSSEFIKTVILRTSLGGDVNAAFNIMKLIRQHGLVTQIDNDLTEYCLSSCALIFASGTQRHWTRNTYIEDPILVLGIHKPDLIEGTYDFLKKEKILDKLKYEILDFLSASGVDSRFSINMFETPNDNMMFPELEDLLVWKTVTELEDPLYFKSLKLRSGHSDKVFSNPNTDKKQFKRPFAYFGYLSKNKLAKNSEEYQTVSAALRDVYQSLNFKIVGN